jgi:hypothetical protein
MSITCRSFPYLAALEDAMRAEYKSIADAGLDLPVGRPDPDICFAKLKTLRDGADLAARRVGS